MLGHLIVSRHFMEPEGSIPNSQELSTCSYPEPDHSSAHQPIPTLQDPFYFYYPPTCVFLVLSFNLAFPPIIYRLSSSPPFLLHGIPLLQVTENLWNIFRN
jgi:hypothetical protein